MVIMENTGCNLSALSVPGFDLGAPSDRIHIRVVRWMTSSLRMKPFSGCVHSSSGSPVLLRLGGEVTWGKRFAAGRMQILESWDALLCGG